MNERHMNPYVAGFLLGLVLLLTIFVTGRGLGASGATKNVVVAAVGAVAPQHAAANPFYAKLLGPGHEAPLKAWLVFEVLGVLIGAFVSGLVADRLRFVTERGPQVSVKRRLLFALARRRPLRRRGPARARLHERRGAERHGGPLRRRLRHDAGDLRQRVPLRVVHPLSLARREGGEVSRWARSFPT